MHNSYVTRNGKPQVNGVKHVNICQRFYETFSWCGSQSLCTVGWGFRRQKYPTLVTLLKVVEHYATAGILRILVLLWHGITISIVIQVVSYVLLLTRFFNFDIVLNKLSSGLVLLFSNPNHRSVFRQNLVLHWHLHIFVIRQILKFFMRSHLKKRHQGFLKYTSFKTLVNRLIR